MPDKIMGWMNDRTMWCRVKKQDQCRKTQIQIDPDAFFTPGQPMPADANRIQQPTAQVQDCNDFEDSPEVVPLSAEPSRITWRLWWHVGDMGCKPNWQSGSANGSMTKWYNMISQTDSEPRLCAMRFGLGKTTGSCKIWRHQPYCIPLNLCRPSKCGAKRSLTSHVLSEGWTQQCHLVSNVLGRRSTVLRLGCANYSNQKPFQLLYKL